MKKFNSARLRFLIMLAVLAVVAVGYFTAGGIGNLCGIGFDTITLLCPLGALLAMIAERTAIPMAVVSMLAVLAVCVVLGKVFCAWACPVHFMARGKKKGKRRALRASGSSVEGGTGSSSVAASSCDATDGSAVSRSAADDPAASRGAADGSAAAPAFHVAQTGESAVQAAAPAPERDKSPGMVSRSACSACTAPCGKAKGIKIDSRHGILAAALGSTLVFGFPVFCLICPIGLTFATVLLVMRLFAFGDTTWTVLAFPAIIAIEVLLLPKWCQRFCPLGALLSLFSGLNRTFRPRIDSEKCLLEGRGLSCNLCERACPEGINLHDVAAGETTLNDCSKCRACADVCPEHAITFPFLPNKGRGASASAPVPASVPAAAGGAASASASAPETPVVAADGAADGGGTAERG
ncbi:4Fe-4S binding protein [Rubneribacter badeniensis]|uniref:4Fe-4S binding protein n=1 Tax=Rubneribacter badeniensis TaxID=2070688 RepID=UPI001EFC8EEB|nr:4Fe-4S binding protein [Rubneribacter badeniensis]